jgi:hypothetical protein
METILNDLSLICALVAILYVWFESDAVIEYAELLRLKFFKYQEYSEMKKRPMGGMAHTYAEFLLLTFGTTRSEKWFDFLKCFLIRLITCPICFSVWCNCLAWSIFDKQIGGIRILSFNIIIVWVFYHLLSYILRILHA